MCDARKRPIVLGMARLTTQSVRVLVAAFVAGLIVAVTPQIALADGVETGDATATTGHVVDSEVITVDEMSARVTTIVSAHMVAHVSGTLARRPDGCVKAVFVFVHHDESETSATSAAACGAGDPVALVPAGSSITSDRTRDVVRYRATVAFAPSSAGPYLAGTFAPRMVGPDSYGFSRETDSLGTCDRLDVDRLSIRSLSDSSTSFAGTGTWGCNSSGETRVRLSPTLSSSGPTVRMEARLVFADGSTAIYAGPWVTSGKSWSGNFYLGWPGERLRSLKLRLVTNAPSSTPPGQTIHLGDIVTTQYSTF